MDDTSGLIRRTETMLADAATYSHVSEYETALLGLISDLAEALKTSETFLAAAVEVARERKPTAVPGE